MTTWSQPALLVGQYERGVLGSWFLPALLVGQFERGWFDEFNGSFTQNPQSNQFCGSTTELIGRCPVFFFSLRALSVFTRQVLSSHYHSARAVLFSSDYPEALETVLLDFSRVLLSRIDAL